MQDEIPSLAEMVEKALARGADAKALQFQGQWYDWAWMRGTAERVDALLAEAGVREDQAIAIAPANQPGCAAVLLGLIAASREVVMIYAYQSPEALARKVRELNCAAVIADAAAWEQPMVEAAQAAGAVGIAVTQEAQSIVPGTQVDRAVDHRVAGAVRGISFLTSGTTGPPKLRHLDYQLMKRSMVIDSVMHAYGTPPAPIPAIHSMAFGNVSGLYSWLPLIVADRPAIMTEKFLLDDYLAYIREYSPPAFGIPVAGFREMIDRDIPSDALGGIAYVSAGASAIDADLQRAVEEKYGVKFLHAYGATEFGGVVSCTLPEHLTQFGPEKSFSVGRPAAGAEFRIADPATGEILPPNQPGVLHIKVPRVGPDWIVTSDLARLDEDGFLWYVGRNDGAIVRGGFKIDPDTVRAALLSHPAISDAIVTGAPDRRLGEVPVAAFVVRSGMTPPDLDELKAHLRARLPATFLPAGYRQVPELPLTPTSKPDMHAVRAMFS